MDGFIGKLLFVDLTDCSSEIRDLDDKMARDFLGGPSLGARILYDEMPAHTDVFAPESVLGFVSGALNGTGALLAGRYTVVSKSPVTNGWNDANSGGTFGMKMKKAGFDAIFIKGIASEPVYLLVDNNEVSFRGAKHLWGKRIEEAERVIKEDLDDSSVGIAMIGPAGERKSRMAAIVNDTHRVAARGGTGAVMGSKNLKALVVRGKTSISIANKEELKKLNQEILEFQKTGPFNELLESSFTKHGTSGFYEMQILAGDCAVKNWTASWIDEYKEDKYKPLTGQEMDKRFYLKRYGCSACHLACGATYRIEEGNCVIKKTGRPEYETQAMLGALILNGNPVTLNYVNYLCNDYGMDTLTMAGTIAWVMECYENGILSLAELDEIKMKWGDADAISAMAEKIAKGEGVGRILQEGSRYAADHFGKGHEALVEASGIEIPQHDPRFAPGMGRTYQYDPTPGRHVKGGMGFADPPEVRYCYDDTGERDTAGVIYKESTNSCGICEFNNFGQPDKMYIKLLSAVAGFEYTEEERQKLGKRLYIMRLAFNLREGFRRKDYTISGRAIGKPPLKIGPTAGIEVENEKLADNFFAEMGFDMDMVPKKEALEDIGGLDFVINDLYPG